MEQQKKNFDMTEYSMLRTEILQYLEEYQTIRNMMYIATGTLLGLGIGTGISFFHLIPLIVIIPSYASHVSYNRCVNKVGTYLRCYWETQEGFPIQWETRNAMYEDETCYSESFFGTSKYKKRQYMAYHLCALVCFVLYFSSIVAGIWEDLMERTGSFILEKLTESGADGLTPTLSDDYPIFFSDVRDMLMAYDWKDLNNCAWLAVIVLQLAIGIILAVYCILRMRDEVPDMKREGAMKIWKKIQQKEEEKKTQMNEQQGPGFVLQHTEAEYDMMRAEILQYMEEYQNLRNMMYVGTATILGFNGAAWHNVYIFLLPLVIILPSYIIYYDYWKSVAAASEYIQIFLERDGTVDGPVRGTRMWETMHKKFSECLVSGRFRERHDPRWMGMMCHKIPYFACAALCMVLYFAMVQKGSFGNTVINGQFAWPLGIVMAILCVAVFAYFRQPDLRKIDEAWMKAAESLGGK